MRSVRGLLVLVIGLAGLLAYLYFVDAERPVGEEEEKPKVFSVEAGQIDALKVSTIAGGVAELEKEGDAWRLVSPVTAEADESEVSAITSALESLAVQRVVDENPSNPGDFGLKEPPVEVSFKTTGTDEFRTLQLGSKTPTGSDMYARVAGEPRVFLVFGYLDSTFAREPFDLRDKTILTFDREKVDRLELQREGGSVVLTKASGEWRVESPVEARADFSTVEGLVSRLQSAQMASIVTEKAADLSKYGLAKPEATAIVGAGSTRAALAFGGKNDEGNVYVRDVNGEGVFTVAADLLTDIQKPLADFRRKDIFEARAYNTGRVELTRDGTTAIFERHAGAGEDGADTWQKSGSDQQVDTGKLEAALSRLLGLRATEFAEAKAGTGATDVLSVRATFDEGKKTDEVTFLRKGETVYARHAGEPGLAVVDTTEFEAALKGLEEFK